MGDNANSNRAVAVLQVIWGAMLAAVLIYLVVGLLAAPRVQVAMNGDTLAWLRKALYAVGFVTLFAIGYVRRLIWKGGQRESGPAPISPATALQRYHVAVIVSLAMSESIGICGLVLSFLGGNQADLLLLIGVSAAAMIYYRPKQEDLSI